MLVSELRDSLGVVKLTHHSAAGQLSAILGAVRNRKVPDAEMLATWVRRRLGNAALQDPLASQFREALGGAPASDTVSASTYSRRFSRVGPYTARDWRAIARLCAHCAAVGASEPLGALPMRTASRYLKQYLHLPYHALADVVGWEWVIEKALRAGRYVEAHL